MGGYNEKIRVKVAVASYDNPRSVNTWSGIPAHIIAELENQNFEVVSIALNQPAEPWYYNWLRSLNWRLTKKWFLSSVEKRYLQDIGRQMDRQVHQNNPDIVLAIYGDILSYTTFKQPACIIHDATFAALLNYYSSFTSLTARSIRAGNTMYKRALMRADAAVFSSAWASKSAINDYDALPGKVYTIPFGANLKQIPSGEEVGIWHEKRLKHDSCNLLFLGVDWERKGGPFALRFVEELNKLNIESYLTIVGIEPEIPVHYQPFVKKIGFLDKSKPSDIQTLKQILSEASALLLPSLAECYGCVFCEANAFGLPALGRDTGGIPEIIKEGVNGLLVGEQETPEDFAKRWAKIWKDKSRYGAMLHSCRNEFEQRLNYGVFVEKLSVIIERFTSNHI